MFTHAKDLAGRRPTCLVAAFSLLVLAAPAHAVDYFWDIAEGDWNVAENWVPLGVPTLPLDDDAYVDNGGVAEVSEPSGEPRLVVIGDFNDGQLFITGGNLTVRRGRIGNQPGSTGRVTVLNAGATWNIGSDPKPGGDLVVGASGNGTLIVRDGGSVDVLNTLFVASNLGTGTLDILNGGTVDCFVAAIGNGTLGSGTVTVDGAGSLLSGFSIEVGILGSGTLVISAGGEVNGPFCNLATQSGSTGTLNIGNGGAPGFLDTLGVSGGPGATVNFNHNDADYFFTSDGTAGGTAVHITGSTAVNQLGSGKTTFTSNPNYAGATTISAGTLQIGNGGTSGTLGSGNVINNSALVFNRSDNLTVGNTISGGGGLTKLGGGTLTLTSSNTYTGTTTISVGTLRIGNGGVSGTLGSGNVINNGALVIDRSNAVSVANLISGSGGLTKLGGNALTLTNNNTYTGGTTIAAGTLNVITNNNLGAPAGGLTFDGGTLRYITDFANSRPVTLGAGGGTVDTNGHSAGFGGVVSGTGLLTKAGAGMLTLTGSNAYTGGTTVRQGTLSVNVGSINHPTALTLVGEENGDDATLVISAGAVTDNFARVGFGAGSVGHVEVTGAGTWTHHNGADFNDLHLGLSGTGSLDVNSSSTVESRDGTLGLSAGADGSAVVSGGGSRWTISRNMILGGEGTGELTVDSGGTVDVDGIFLMAAAFSTGTLNIGSGGAAGIVNAASVEGGLGGSATVNFNHNDADYFFTNDGTDGGTPVLITAETAVNHLGSGKTTLTGNHTYSQATTLDAGTLIVNGSISNSGVVVNAGATLGGSGAVGNLLVIGGTVAPGNSAGTLSAISYTQDAGGTLEIEITGPTPGIEYDQLTIIGGNVILGQQVTQVTFPAPSGAFAPTARLYIIDNTGAGTTTGAFLGLPDGGAAGTPVPAIAGLGGFAQWRIYYHADSASGQLSGGNDVALIPVVPGDMNCDGLVDELDIEPLALALTDADAYGIAFANCGIGNGDTNCDGLFNALDIQPFMDCLLTTSCGCQ